ncbi:MAG TPA: phospholipase domain-containing protein, partial [Chitinophagaceae bacterium]|nr:phospholipase domain-containing protein [Chitinophagaceae bacterium]
LTGNIELRISNPDSSSAYTIEVRDNAYKNSPIKKMVGKKGSGKERASILIDCGKSFGWYDFTIKITGNKKFERRYAGRVETGEFSRTDPAMGNIR